MSEWKLSDELGSPETLERAIAERNAWCDTATLAQHNVDYYRGQRNAFLEAALVDPAVAAVAQRIVGDGWRRLLDDDATTPPDPGGEHE